MKALRTATSVLAMTLIDSLDAVVTTLVVGAGVSDQAQHLGVPFVERKNDQNGI